MIRGSTSAQVNIYVDGVLQNLSSDGAIDLSTIPTENVARIEVYRGYVPVRFSGAPLGGVVNIVTKKPEGLGVRVALGLKSFNGRSGDLDISVPFLTGSILLGLHHDKSDGDFKYPFVSEYTTTWYQWLPQTRRRQSNGYENSNILLKWQDPNWYVKVAWKKKDRYYPEPTNSNFSQGYIDLPWDGNLSHLSPEHNQILKQYDVVLGRRQVWKNLEFGIEATYTNQKKHYQWTNNYYPLITGSLWIGTPIGALWNVYNNERFGVSLDGTYKLGDRNLVEFRFDYLNEEQFQDANRRGSNEGGGFIAESYMANLSGSIKYPMFYKYNRKQWHAQISDTITLNEKKDLWLTFIARWDDVNDSMEVEDTNTRGFATWGLAVKKNIDDVWTIRATGGTFVRYPNFYELYGDGVYVKPIDNYSGSMLYRSTRETGRQMDFGIDWRSRLLDIGTNISLTWFNRRTDDMIGPVYRWAEGTMYYMNVGDTEAAGVEFEANLRGSHLDVDVMTTWMDYARMRARNLTGGLSFTNAGKSMTNIPKWEGNFRAGYRLFNDSLTLFIEHHYTGQMPTPYGFVQTDMGWDLRPLNVTNMGLHYSFPWGMKFSLGINDIANNQPKQSEFDSANRMLLIQERGIQFPSQGRTWYTTVEYVF
jgi:outer membrane receptor protein involved in Fe transport